MEEVVRLSFSQEVEGVVAVGLESFSLVDHLSSISVENSPFPVFLSERVMKPFSDAVDKVRGKFSSNLEVMIAKDDLLMIGREKHGPIEFTGYSEVKRILSEFEVDTRKGNGETEVGEGVDGEHSMLRHFISLLFCINYFEGEVVVGEHVEGEGQFLGDGTGGFEIVLILACIFQVQSDNG